MLEDAGLYREALEIWNLAIEKQPKEHSIRRYIRCAVRLNAHDAILRGCQILRQAGKHDSELIQLEVDVREQYDIESTIAVLQEHLAARPDDAVARVRLSYVGVVHGRSNLVDAENVPAPERVSALQGRVAVMVLKHAGKSLDAVRYGYLLLHLYFDDPDAHRAYMFALHPIGPKVELPIPDTAGPGTAISYIEDADNSQHWVVIEDDFKADARLEEISAEHPLAAELMGKRIGDSINLDRGAFVPRTAKIAAISNKYVYRYQRTLSEFQSRFPGASGVQVVHVGKPGSPGEFDFSALEKAELTQHANRLEAEALYRRQPAPLHLIARTAGKSDPEALIYLATQDEPFVRVCVGSVEERGRSLAALRTAKAVVIDVIAITTLGFADGLDELGNTAAPLLVTQGTIQVFKELLRDSTDLRPLGYLGIQNAQQAMAETEPKEWERRVEWLRGIIDSLEKYCTIVPANRLATLAAEQRENLTLMFGRHGAEAMLLASESGHVLWSDDFALRMIAASEFGVQRVWTQLALEQGVETGRVASERFIELSAHLLGAGYSFTGINLDIFMKVGELSAWNTGRKPFRQVLAYLANDGVDLLFALQLAAVAIHRISREVVMPEVLNGVVVGILASVAKRRGGLDGIMALRGALPQIFGLDVFSLKRVVNAIDAWIRQHRSEQ